MERQGTRGSTIKRRASARDGAAPLCQLRLPLEAGVVQEWELRPRPRSTARLTVVLAVNGARVKLQTRGPHGGATRPRTLWSFGINMRPTKLTAMPMFRAFPAHLLEPELADGDLDLSLRAGLKAFADCRPDARAMERARQLMGVTQRHLRGCGVPHALEAASRFPRATATRLGVYLLCATDATGRTAQLATVCPGVLLALCMVWQTRGVTACAPVVEAVVSGARLPRVIRACVGAWSDARAARGVSTDDAQRRLQCAWIRRASATASADDVWQQAPRGIAPADIPAGEVANAKWYRRVVGTVEVAARRAGSALPVNWWAFLSKHALDPQFDVPMCGAANTEESQFSELMEWLLDYVCASGREPDRRTDPKRLLDECDRWHDENEWKLTHDPEEPLELGQFRGPVEWFGHEAVIRRMATLGELAAESREMSHCIISYADEAVSGSFQAFRATIFGERVTIGLSIRPDGRVTHVQVKRFANAALTPEQSDAAERWLADVNCRWAESINGEGDQPWPPEDAPEEVDSVGCELYWEDLDEAMALDWLESVESGIIEAE